jgi:multiple sugar transport system permease protein
MSVHDVALVSGGTRWSFAGLDHWRNALNDPIARIALRNTLVFAAVVVPTQAILGLLLAYMVGHTRRLNTFYRTMIILPMLLPPIAIGAIWRLMYDFNVGPINQVLTSIGVNGPLWLSDTRWALPSVMIVDTWHWTSFMFLILLAGMQSIPSELHEAAAIDGASRWQDFRHIVLPILQPTIVVALMLRTIMSFKVFDVPYLLTGGGPGTATEMISLYIEKVYFRQFRLGHGAALALATAVILGIFIIIYARATRRRGGGEVA